jgi:hypothetical protein
MPNINLPISFKLLKATVNLRLHSENKKLLTRFVYRYRLAKSFTEIIADDIGRTIKGYNAILKVFLTYTAYEQLLKGAYGLRVFGLDSVDRNRIEDAQLAEKLRKNKQLINFLIEYSTDSILIAQLVSFRKNSNNDVVCVAYAIRNVFAHGELTATPIGVALKTERTTLLELADFLLNYCDDIFTKCVEKLR